jgi:hypothetical protein
MTQMEGLGEALGEIGPDEAGRDALRLWIEHFFDIYSKHSTVIRAWTEGEIVDNDLGRQGQRLLGRLTQQLASRIEDTDTAAAADPQVAALACLAMLERFTYLVQSRQVNFERETMLDSLAAVVHVGFFAGNAETGLDSSLDASLDASKARKLRRAR